MIKEAIEYYSNATTGERLCIWWSIFLTAITCAHMVFTS